MINRDLDTWVKRFNACVAVAVSQPARELATSGAFSDWRMTYGIQTFPSVVDKIPGTFFLSLYPAFCTAPKGTFHYTNVSELASDVIAMEALEEDAKIPLSDVVATVCSFMRNKESIELFQEQKDLMTLGLKHFHLDNYYQDVIKAYVKELYEQGTVRGVKVSLTIFKAIKDLKKG
jgi:hypothetical protein